MSKTFVSAFVACLLLASTFVETAYAQCTPAASRARVIVADAGAGRDTLWFGHDVNGSYGLNTTLCEIELPPAPPLGIFDSRWMNIPGRDNPNLDTPAGLGQGFGDDYRQYVNPTKIDTFKVGFQAGDGGFPFTFSWNTIDITAICDSAILQDGFGGIIVKVRMHVANTAVVPNGFTSLFLIRYGQKNSSDVQPIGSELPTQFELAQNYPNPFNPSTTIRFGVERLAHTEVAVFDVLGRKVATLVSENLAPGFYSVNWDGKNELGIAASTGTYLLRMTAVNEQNQSFTALRKLLLMK